MEKDCGAWINLLSHKFKAKLDATFQDFGITGVQSRILYYIQFHCQRGPVFQRDIEPFYGDGDPAAFGEKRHDPQGERSYGRQTEELGSDPEGH